MQRRMVPYIPPRQNFSLTISQLTKEEEGGNEDMEVRREDQEKINRFSSLHQKETALEEELRGKIVSTIRGKRSHGFRRTNESVYEGIDWA